MAELQYIFTKRFEDILGKKFKSPCHISDEDKALVVDMIVNPIPFIQSGSNWVNITPAKNWNTFVVRKDTTTQARQNSVSLVQNPTYKKIAENFGRIMAVQIDAECGAYRRLNTIFDPIDPQTDDIEFTEEGILSVRINQLLPELRTQVRPAFLAWKNAQLRIVALNQRLWLNEDDLSQLQTWSEDFDRLANSGDVDTLISLYGATCIPYGARKRDGTLYQGALFETGTESNPENIYGAVGEKQEELQTLLDLGIFKISTTTNRPSDLCRVNNLPPYFARPQRENIYSAGSQEVLRAYQRDVAGDRRRFWNNEINRLKSQISKIKDTDLPQAINAEKTALAKWKEVQEIVLKYVAKQVQLQVQSAEAQTQAQRIEAQRQIELAKQQTLQELTKINASLSLSRQRNLMILGAGAVGLAGIALLTRGGQMNAFGKIALSAGLLGGAIYGFSHYKKFETATTLEITGDTTDNTITTEEANEILATFTARAFSRKRVETKVGTQCSGRMTLEQQKACEAQFTAFNNFDNRSTKFDKIKSLTNDFSLFSGLPMGNV